MKRVVMWLVIVFILTMVLSGCGSKPVTEPTAAPEETQEPEEAKAPGPQETEVEEIVYKESPFFQGRELPPVKDRLPKEPKLTNEMPPSQRPYEIGTYGVL